MVSLGSSGKEGRPEAFSAKTPGGPSERGHPPELQLEKLLPFPVAQGAEEGPLQDGLLIEDVVHLEEAVLVAVLLRLFTVDESALRSRQRVRRRHQLEPSEDLRRRAQLQTAQDGIRAGGPRSGRHRQRTDDLPPSAPITQAQSPRESRARFPRNGAAIPGIRRSRPF